MYKLTHRITGQFYFGYRCKNKVPASQDLGIRYFTSGKITKEHFREFDYEIVAEFADADEAYDVEQRLIYQHKNNPLILNKQYRIDGGKRWTCRSYNQESRSKMSISAIAHRSTLSVEQKKKIYSKVSASITGDKNPRALNWIIEYEDGRKSEKVKSLNTWCATNGYKYMTMYSRATRNIQSFWKGIRVLRA